MSAIFNHLIHPLTYTVASGERRYLTPKDTSRIKNLVLLAVGAAALESYSSSRSLKSSLVIMGLTAGAVFYLVAAILKRLRGNENQSPERSSLNPQVIPDLPDIDFEAATREMDADLRELERGGHPHPRMSDEQRAKRREQQKDLLDGMYEEVQQLHADLDQLLQTPLQKKSVPPAQSRPVPPRPSPAEPQQTPPKPRPVQKESVLPVQSRAAPPRPSPSAEPQPSSTANTVWMSSISSFIWGEEDFTMKPSWIDDPRYRQSFEREYFAKLWHSMYGKGLDVWVSEIECDKDKLREGTLKFDENAPWASFARHAQERLRKEWKQKGPVERTLSGVLPFF